MTTTQALQETVTVEPNAPPRREPARAELIAGAVTLLFFLVLFWQPIITLGRDWWNDPEAGHGLLLAPVAVWLAWKSGLAPQRRAQRGLGILLLAAAVLLRYVSGLAAELFTMRLSLLGALFAAVIYLYGMRQLLRWWLPVALLILSVPIPAVILNSLALPLQLQASEIGATLLAWRHVPVVLAGNVIHLPDRALFVTEACSGLRSLTALLSLGLLIGGLWLRYPVTRIVLLVAAVPIGVALNSLRVFITGFLVYFVDPRLGDGLLHYTEGWVMFVAAFALLGCMAWVLTTAERLVRYRRSA